MAEKKALKLVVHQVCCIKDGELVALFDPRTSMEAALVDLQVVEPIAAGIFIVTDIFESRFFGRP